MTIRSRLPVILGHLLLTKALKTENIETVLLLLVMKKTLKNSQNQQPPHDILVFYCLQAMCAVCAAPLAAHTTRRLSKFESQIVSRLKRI